MQIKQRVRKRIGLLLILVIASQFGWAGDPPENRPMALRGIMQEMSRNMQAITDAIAREGWEEIVGITPLIADHPQPPITEKLRILAFFSGKAGEFKKYGSSPNQVGRLA